MQFFTHAIEHKLVCEYPCRLNTGLLNMQCKKIILQILVVVRCAEGWAVVEDMVLRELTVGRVTPVVVRIVRVAGIWTVLKELGVWATLAFGAAPLIWACWVIIWVDPTAGLKIWVPGAAMQRHIIVILLYNRESAQQNWSPNELTRKKTKPAHLGLKL